MKHRSIGDRMKRAKSLRQRKEIAEEWAIEWQRRQALLRQELEQALAGKRPAAFVSAALKEDGDKHFRGLLTLIDALTDDDIL